MVESGEPEEHKKASMERRPMAAAVVGVVEGCIHQLEELQNLIKCKCSAELYEFNRISIK